MARPIRTLGMLAAIAGLGGSAAAANIPTKVVANTATNTITGKTRPPRFKSSHKPCSFSGKNRAQRQRLSAAFRSMDTRLAWHSPAPGFW